MDDIFSEIMLKKDESLKDSLVVGCKMDGIRMPVKKLSPKDTLFIGTGPDFDDSQKLWAVRMAYRGEMKRNQRVQNFYIRQDKEGNYLARCRIDGVQQLSEKITPTEAKMYERGLMTERELVNRYYQTVLQNDRGRVLDESTSRNLTLSISQKKTS